MILSQICETMIRMSRNSRYAAWLVAAAIVSLVGCCGGGSTHKCDFTPPPTDAGGTDSSSSNCGPQNCASNQVCCVTKTPPFASCIDPKDFLSYGCEMFQLQAPPCATSHDCDGGVCCYQSNLQTISCQKSAACPANGMDTAPLCQTDQDCVAPGVCRNLGSGGGFSLNVCWP